MVQALVGPPKSTLRQQQFERRRATSSTWARRVMVSGGTPPAG